MADMIHSEQKIPVALDEAWAFFSTPRNLDELTPPDLRFSVRHLDSETMYEGQMIHYRIRLAPMVWTTWITEIARVEGGDDWRLFVDEQRLGPYHLWHHRHHFKAIQGGVLMSDEVHYHVGKGPIGALAEALYVNRQVRKIFRFREKAVRDRFGEIKGQ